MTRVLRLRTEIDWQIEEEGYLDVIFTEGFPTDADLDASRSRTEAALRAQDAELYEPELWIDWDASEFKITDITCRLAKVGETD